MQSKYHIFFTFPFFLALFITCLISCSGGGGGGNSDAGLPPARPSISATPGDGQVTLTWLPASNASTYNIYWSNSLDVDTSNASLIENVASGYVHTGLSNGTPYFYIVTAKNAEQESTPSSVDRATPSASVLLDSLNFDDANLAQCIADVAASSGLTYIYELINLNCDNRNIASLQGLEVLTSLENLRLSGNVITDISPLANLPSLAFFFMWGGGNNISDLAPLGSLVNLTYLNLSFYNRSFANTSALAQLVHMEQLFLLNNVFSDIGFLTDMPKLYWLDLTGSQGISDFTVIFSLNRLGVLRLGSTNLSDIGPISSLVDLQRLDISGNSIVDFSPLNSLSNLVNLDIGSSGITDIGFIENLGNIQTLNIRDNNISDLSVLAGRDSMLSLIVDHNNISDISVIADMSEISELGLGDNNITDFSVLSGISSLHSFEATNSGLSNIAFLMQNSELTTLRLGGNNFSTVSEFIAYPQLSFLMLNDNNIAAQGVGKVDELAALSLSRVSLSGNPDMSCAELGSLIDALGSPPVDTDMNFSSVDTAMPGVNCGNP